MIHGAKIPVGDYRYYGYRLRSSISLCNLPPLTLEDSADLVLEQGEVPFTLDNPQWRTPIFQVDDLGRGLVTLDGRVRFLVTEGRKLRVNDDTLEARKDVETLLQGVVAGVVLHQRGALVLHASCVAERGRAIAISGVSGQGKSTLAAALTAQGLSLLSDDLTRVDVTEGHAQAYPGPARVRLLPDAAKALHHSPETLEVGREGHPKRLLVLPHATAPAPLKALLRLSVDTRLKRPTLTRLMGMDSLMPIEELIYRARLCRWLGRSEEMFQNLTSLVRMVPVYRLTRTGNVRDLPELVALVREALARDVAA